jgi:hypothetical protein
MPAEHPPLDDLPCVHCGKTIGRHGGADHLIHLADDAYEHLTKQEWLRLLAHRRRSNRGDLDPPLPRPRERRRLREAVGLSQEDVGDLIGVSRHMVSRFEKRAIYQRSIRSGGREPVGAVRARYGKVLDCMEIMERTGRTKNAYAVLLAVLEGDDRDS